MPLVEDARTRKPERNRTLGMHYITVLKSWRKRCFQVLRISRARSFRPCLASRRDHRQNRPSCSPDVGRHLSRDLQVDGYNPMAGPEEFHLGYKQTVGTTPSRLRILETLLQFWSMQVNVSMGDRFCQLMFEGIHRCRRGHLLQRAPLYLRN